MDKTRDQIALDLLRRIRTGSAFDLMALYEEENQFSSAEDRNRFCQGVHGSLSGLFDEGKIARPSMKLNPSTGKEVYVYEILDVQRKPTAKASKGYKDKYEEASAQLKSETDRADWLAARYQKAVGEIESLKAQLAAAKKAA
jgi:hypothetical protein